MTRWKACKMPGKEINGWYVQDIESGKALTGWGRVTQTEENARLMASAPQLLEACKNSWDAIASLKPDALGGVDPKSPTEEGYYIRDAILDDIAHAIQAAEGEGE